MSGFHFLFCLALSSSHFLRPRDTSQTQSHRLHWTGSGFLVWWFVGRGQAAGFRRITSIFVRAFGWQGRHTHRHTAQRGTLDMKACRVDRQTGRPTDRAGYGLLAEHRPPTVRPWPVRAAITDRISGPVKTNCMACCTAPDRSQDRAMSRLRPWTLLSGAANLIWVFLGDLQIQLISVSGVFVCESVIVFLLQLSFLSQGCELGPISCTVLTLGWRWGKDPK